MRARAPVPVQCRPSRCAGCRSEGRAAVERRGEGEPELDRRSASPHPQRFIPRGFARPDLRVGNTLPICKLRVTRGARPAVPERHWRSPLTCSAALQLLALASWQREQPWRASKKGTR